MRNYIVEEHINYFDPEHPFTHLSYRCSAREIRDRLELKGLTLEIAKVRFDAGLNHDIRRLESLVQTGRIFEELRPAREEELRLLQSLTLENWLEAIRRIEEEQLTAETIESLPSSSVDLPLLRYMLRFPNKLYGFPGPGYDVPMYDYLLFLRLLTEALSQSDELVYDLSHLVYGGYIEAEDDQTSVEKSELDSTATLSESVIVLTEGTIDRQFLERSLNLLYPHLIDYFHFFEFDLNRDNRLGGGVGNLANLVRAFTGASVRHRILALFDNDTASKDALRNLDPSILPENIIFRYYPDLEIAADYPTFGPTGSTQMNVNGLAGSIEMYLGYDVLEGDDGQLIPVQWTGFYKRVNAYQGELMDKRAIQQRFFDKLNACERSPDKVDDYDWEGIRAILNVMRTAFQDLDSELILNSYQSLLGVDLSDGRIEA